MWIPDDVVCITVTRLPPHRSVKAVLESTAAAKKTKHRLACNDRRADFSPFVCSSDGAVHREGVHVMKKVAARLAEKSYRREDDHGR